MTKPITPDMLPEAAIEAGMTKYSRMQADGYRPEFILECVLCAFLNTAIESGEATFIQQQPAGPTWPYQGSAILIKLKDKP